MTIYEGRQFLAAKATIESYHGSMAAIKAPVTIVIAVNISTQRGPKLLLFVCYPGNVRNVPVQMDIMFLIFI